MTDQALRYRQSKSLRALALMLTPPAFFTDNRKICRGDLRGSLVTLACWFAAVAVELVRLAEARNRAGGSQQDVLRAQLQVDGIEDRLVELARRRDLAKADLAAVIQQPRSSAIAVTGDLAVQSTVAELDALIAAAERCTHGCASANGRCPATARKHDSPACSSTPTLTSASVGKRSPRATLSRRSPTVETT